MIRRSRTRAEQVACVQDAFDACLLELGEQIDRARKRRGFSLERLASRAGLGERTVRALLNLETDPKVSTLVRLAAALNARIMIRIEARRSSPAI